MPAGILSWELQDIMLWAYSCIFIIMFRELNVQNVVYNICGDLLQKYQAKGPGSAKVPQGTWSHISQADHLYHEKKKKKYVQKKG